MTVALRELQWPDLPVVEALDARIFGRDAWSAQSWWSELAGRPRRSYVVAVHDGTVAGYGGLDRAGATADVMTLAVDPAVRGHGVGRLLLQELIAQAAASGAEALLLEVRADNEPARRLYQGEGFAHIQTRRNYYRPDNVDAHIMRAVLKDPHHD